MPSNEGHIHWSTSSTTATANFAEQDLELLPGTSEDPEGSVRIRATGDTGPGLHIPTEGWETVPGTSPALEARADANDPMGYVRLRIA